MSWEPPLIVHGAHRLERRRAARRTGAAVPQPLCSTWRTKPEVSREQRGVQRRGILTNAMIYLAAAVVCVPLASRSKLGSVLGYLAAGCVIGPFGLRLVADPEATLHFAEIGVVLMLFVIGLELDPVALVEDAPQRVRRRRPAAVRVRDAARARARSRSGCRGRARWWRAWRSALSSTAIAMQTMAEKSLLTSPWARRRSPSCCFRTSRRFR